jgi:hypothetical protein
MESVREALFPTIGSSTTGGVCFGSLSNAF